MDWSKEYSYDRFLDIHVINKQYDFIEDVEKQYNYQQKEIQKVIDNPTNYLLKRRLPTKSEWKKLSYVGIFAGRRDETEAIDNLLDKFHRTNDLTEQKKCIDEIYLNITKYLVRENQGRNRGARWAAYNDLLTMVNRCDLNYKNPNEIFLAKKKSIPVAIKDFVHFSVKCDSSGIKDLKNYPHSKLIDKLYNPKENYTFNGYLSVFIDIHDIKNITIHDNYKAILTWVSELGRLGKVRFNCHGDGKGNLTMQSLAKVNGERPQNSVRESCNGDNIINWMIGNNYFSHCIEANYKTTQKATFEASRNYSVNNTNVNSYAGTISVAACMAGREVWDLNNNLTTKHNSPIALAHDDSLLSSMVRNLNAKTLPVIKVTGAHEVVANTETQGMIRNFSLNYFERNNLVTVHTKNGFYYYEINIPGVTLHKSVSGNELSFETSKSSGGKYFKYKQIANWLTVQEEYQIPILNSQATQAQRDEAAKKANESQAALPVYTFDSQRV